MPAAADKQIEIADSGAVLTLDYDGALAVHAGESWFGLAVGFRMLQAAGAALSQRRLWQRQHLFVVSGHPGGGVRDAIEYVTHCVSQDRFRLETGDQRCGCGRNMRFAWEIGDGAVVAAVHLRDGFVPETLYQLLDRRGTPQELPDDACAFARLKRELAARVWTEPLAQLFTVNRLQAGLRGHA